MEPEEQLLYLAESVNHIEFKDYPKDFNILNELADYNPLITFDLSFSKQKRAGRKRRGSARPITPGCLSDCTLSRITAAHVETDCFVDVSDFYVFDKLETLYLYVSNQDCEYYDSREVSNLWFILLDLAHSGNLKRVVFDISRLTETAQEQIKELFVVPDNQIQLELIEPRKKKQRVRKTEEQQI